MLIDKVPILLGLSGGVATQAPIWLACLENGGVAQRPTLRPGTGLGMTQDSRASVSFNAVIAGAAAEQLHIMQTTDKLTYSLVGGVDLAKLIELTDIPARILEVLCNPRNFGILTMLLLHDLHLQQDDWTDEQRLFYNSFHMVFTGLEVGNTSANLERLIKEQYPPRPQTGRAKSATFNLDTHLRPLRVVELIHAHVEEGNPPGGVILYSTKKESPKGYELQVSRLRLVTGVTIKEALTTINAAVAILNGVSGN